MKDSARSWMAFADRDIEAAKIFFDNEYVSNVIFTKLLKKLFSQKAQGA